MSGKNTSRNKSRHKKRCKYYKQIQTDTKLKIFEHQSTKCRCCYYTGQELTIEFQDGKNVVFVENYFFFCFIQRYPHSTTRL